MFETGVAILIMLTVGFLMIAPFFRCRGNPAFQLYCFGFIFLTLLCWIFKIDRHPLLGSVLALPLAVCMLAGWCRDPLFKKRR